MRVLLDTHTLIWAVDDPSQISPIAATAMNAPTNRLLLSAATVWELAIKVGLGKLTLSAPYLDWMNAAISKLSLARLEIELEYADAQSRLPPHHGDPFDRLLIAQALVENIAIVSVDTAFDPYGVNRIW